MTATRAVEALPGDRQPDWVLVLRKELGDLAGRTGRRPLIRTLVVVAVFGLLVPVRFEGAANLPAFFAVFMAFVPARLVAIDALAGERERGTLEGLLASPLSDAGIAVGKIAAATVYGAVRGWLFLAVWVCSAAVLRATGLVAGAPLPPVPVAVGVAVAGVVVAYAAAVFGVWQSAFAPSVRAIVETGGLLRLAIILTVFFVGPWLFGLLSPDGSAPALPLPGTGALVSLDGLRDVLVASPGAGYAAAAVAGTAGLAGLWWFTAASLRRCRRESLALVNAVGDGSLTTRQRRSRGPKVAGRGPKFLPPGRRGRN